MQYFANPVLNSNAVMRAGLIDFIDTPKQGNSRIPGVIWCADNGCFGKGYPGDEKWFQWLVLNAYDVRTCAFAVAPDVVGDADATLVRSLPWLPAIRALGYPAAFVAQDGATVNKIPWGEFDVLFIGGTTEFKLGPDARHLVNLAKRVNKRVHMGRVNSKKRFIYAESIGCDSVDGTYLIYGPKTNLPKLLLWMYGDRSITTGPEGDRMIDIEALTKDEVLRLRKEFHLTRQQLADLAGLKVSRILGIENSDVWKPGDGDKIHAVFVSLESSPPPAKLRGRALAEHLQTRLENSGKSLSGGSSSNGHVAKFWDEDDEELERLTREFRETVARIPQEWRTSNGGQAHSAKITEKLILGMPKDGVLVTEQEDDEPTTFVVNEGTGEVVGTIVDDVVVPNPDSNEVRRLSNSEVSVWQDCRRKWWLEFYRGYAMPTNFTNPRSIGTRVHAALAAWYVPDALERTDPRDALERAIVDDLTKIVNAAQEQGYDEGRIAEMSAAFNTSVDLERAMIEGYITWLAETGEDSDLVIDAPETPLSAVIEGTVAGDDVRVKITGLLDARARREQSGTRVLIDHKTNKDFTTPQKTIHQDPQMLHYMLLEWLNTPEGEERCDTALYNMLRKVKRSGNAKPPFYQRLTVHHSDIELDSYRRRLLGVARDIKRATSELDAGADPLSVVYPHPTRDCSWKCDFFAICTMFDDGSRAEDALTGVYKKINPMKRYQKDQDVSSDA